MPPYTVDEGLDNIISRKHGHISLVSLYPARRFSESLIHVCLEFLWNEHSSRLNRCVSINPLSPIIFVSVVPIA